MGFTVAIVGRPNVGKSTLFNRLIGAKKSIIDDISGVTRDRIYGLSEWNGKTFNVIDTGGFVPNSDDIFEAAIRDQVQIAMDEADLILFMVDVTTGITDLDESMARMLRRSKKPRLLAINKVDNSARQFESGVFAALGLGEGYNISSVSGSGTGELLDALTEHIKDQNEIEESEIPRIAILGQPNVGKSSLVNALIGEKRNIVTDIAGTTRDAIHSHYKKFGKDLMLIDTAGIRRKSKVHENLEFYSVIRAINAIDEAEICILIVDARDGVTQQDLNIFRLIQKKGKGVMLVCNKWDLVKKNTETAKELEEKIHRKIAPFTDVPILFTSALEKQRIFKILEIALEIYDARLQKISTSKLNEAMSKVIERYRPPVYKGKSISIKYVTQLPVIPPAFAFFCNLPQYIRDPYKNYLENQLRSMYNFSGVPIRIYFRKK